MVKKSTSWKYSRVYRGDGWRGTNDRKKLESVLHPGNEKYQDIKIKIEDFFINGVVLGVIPGFSET